MRHFAKRFGKKGYNVEYITLDNPDNTGSFNGELERMLSKYSFDYIIVAHPGEYRVLNDIKSLGDRLNIQIEIREDDRFLCSFDEFNAWVSDKKHLRMEYFYREMRKKI